MSFMNRDTCGFLIGLAAGAGLGILLAPRSGERTRLLLRGRARDGATYLREQGAAVREAAAGAIRDSTRKVAKEADAVKAAVEAGRQAYSESTHT
jgi:gas vesicle protein